MTFKQTILRTWVCDFCGNEQKRSSSATDKETRKEELEGSHIWGHVTINAPGCVHAEAHLCPECCTRLRKLSSNGGRELSYTFKNLVKAYAKMMGTD